MLLEQICYDVPVEVRQAFYACPIASNKSEHIGMDDEYAWLMILEDGGDTDQFYKCKLILVEFDQMDNVWDLNKIGKSYPKTSFKATERRTDLQMNPKNMVPNFMCYLYSRGTYFNMV